MKIKLTLLVVAVLAGLTACDYFLWNEFLGKTSEEVTEEVPQEEMDADLSESLEVETEEAYLYEEKSLKVVMRKDTAYLDVLDSDGNSMYIKLIPGAFGPTKHKYISGDFSVARPIQRFATEQGMLEVLADFKLVSGGTSKKDHPGVTVNETFKYNLYYADKKSAVKKLQSFLNLKGFEVAIKGEGSADKETINFKDGTADALYRYKESNKRAIKQYGPFVSSGSVLDHATRMHINLVISKDNEETKLSLEGSP